jgi:hypothetical protein
MTADVPAPKVPGEDAPGGFNRNEVLVYKEYFCKYMCQNNWDNFSDMEVFSNEQLKENARALYNKESEETFLEEIFEPDAGYQRMARFVVDSLVKQGLLEREEKPNEAIYLRTSKLKELCSKILAYNLPVIDALVEEYNKQKGVSRDD